ncbi:hypothetical protein [Candidatus Rickettsia kedanie]|uniref:Uncharacterized protein n=1 Tax=Candidatus Rickettsia kedanie TaxID=3115352 RepID=A0ABP9TVB9_9RICK
MPVSLYCLKEGKEDIIIAFDRDSISELTEKRENLWVKISTLNEKRAFVGLPPIINGDKL